MRDYKWAIKTPKFGFHDVRDYRNDAIGAFMGRRLYDDEEWKWYYRRGFRCVKVRIVDVEP